MTFTLSLLTSEVCIRNDRKWGLRISSWIPSSLLRDVALSLFLAVSGKKTVLLLLQPVTCSSCFSPRLVLKLKKKMTELCHKSSNLHSYDLISESPHTYRKGRKSESVFVAMFGESEEPHESLALALVALAVLASTGILVNDGLVHTFSAVAPPPSLSSLPSSSTRSTRTPSSSASTAAANRRVEVPRRVTGFLRLLGPN
ncbi:hypothetical protein BC830DRAFT_404931 [Chytriomyces sp. MP71]|nr:hypothetical protein BC830DRAFT_404931 [Chytriomyces sp. MP71]